MVRNQEKYDQAVSLRKRGFTLEEIAKYCDISKSTASKWLENKAFSAQITKQNIRRAGQENAKRLKLVNKARGIERAAKYRDIERSAETEYKHYKASPLFAAGLMLYLSSGDLKDKRSVRITSTKIEVHKIFIKFLAEYLGVDKSKLRFWLILYSSKDETSFMKKWSKNIGISYAQFYKNQILKGQSPKQTLHYGVGNTIIASTVLKRKLSKWIELAGKELSK